MHSLSTPNADPTTRTQFTVGAKVRCRSGDCGELTRVIVDPIGRVLTHIVVESGNNVQGRLVPLSLVESSTPDLIDLTCTLREFDDLAPSHDSDYLPMDDPTGAYYRGFARGYGYDWSHVGFWPYYGFGGVGYGWAWQPRATSYEAIPDGEVTIRRDDPVHATDGDIGRVAGLVIDHATGAVSHLLLHEGHLWGRKDVAIPIGVVQRAHDGIRCELSTQEVQDLPPVELAR